MTAASSRLYSCCFPKPSAVIRMITCVQYSLFSAFSLNSLSKFLLSFVLFCCVFFFLSSLGSSSFLGIESQNKEREIALRLSLWEVIRGTHLAGELGVWFLALCSLEADTAVSSNIHPPLHTWLHHNREKIHGEKAIYCECLPMQILDA